MLDVGSKPHASANHLSCVALCNTKHNDKKDATDTIKIAKEYH